MTFFSLHNFKKKEYLNGKFTVSMFTWWSSDWIPFYLINKSSLQSDNVDKIEKGHSIILEDYLDKFQVVFCCTHFFRR